MRAKRVVAVLAGVSLFAICAAAFGDENLIANPSFETVKDAAAKEPAFNADYKDGGVPFAGWQGTVHEGRCEFRASAVSRTGKISAMLVGRVSPKMRLYQVRDLEPGRYRVTAYLRGLDIGKGTWNWTTEFMFNENYVQLEKNGTFGWTKLTYVGEVKEKKKVIGPSFGLCAPGYLWVDDVTLEKVGEDVPLTPKPVLGAEEAPIAPPGKIEAGFVRCPECFYRNMPAWKACYACGTALDAKKPAFAGPAVKLITSFEDGSPFSLGDDKASTPVVEEHATDGKKALRLDKSYASMDKPQNWMGYDWLKADVYTDAQDPMNLLVELRDTGTTDYWTRVNYETVIPPGKSTLMIPIKNLYRGEKSRPGGPFDPSHVTRLVFSIGDKPQAPLFIDNIRVEVDDAADKVKFDGLYAFDFQPGNSSPVLEGFLPIVPGMDYTEGRGYGLKNAKVSGAVDAMQPDPLYEDYISITSGGLLVDVPNGKYRVFVNLDRPALYWGEYQHFTERSVIANGAEVVNDTEDADGLKKRYYHFWNTEDLPGDSTFDKYQKFYFPGKTFDVDVTDGKLMLEFRGAHDACDVSAVIIYPLAKAAEGEKFMKYVEDRRRFHFDNYFKRVLHRPTGDALGGEAKGTGTFVAFTRDIMKEVYYNDTPFKDEIGKPMTADVFAGELAALNVAVAPRTDLGKVTVTAGALAGPAGAIPAADIDVGYVSYRITRVTMEGSIYTISPRLVMPTNTVEMPRDVTRRFWLTVRTPADAKPGIYKGTVSIRSEKGGALDVPMELRVRSGRLDEVDIPAGPWGYTIDYVDPKKCLKKMRDYGFTDFSSGPVVRYSGFRNGKPQLDFSAADKLMATAKELGFKGVVFYNTLVYGYNAYFEDTAAMQAAGFKDYSEFIKALYTDVQKHADEQGWVPYFVNLGDEPIGDDVVKAAVNCEAYRKAFPKGPPYFTFATSCEGTDAKTPHFRLCKAVEIPDLNGHDEPAIKILHDAGCQWAFYNGGNRWTFGDYMFKAVTQFGMKFRISWHWNCCAGDPYYALDCREDDYAWCTTTPDGDLISSLDLFERKREGLGDYRRLLTLARLAKEKAGTPASAAGEKLLADRMASFKLGQRDHDALFGVDDYLAFRAKVNDAIDSLRK